jgi:hypothetical protein
MPFDTLTFQDVSQILETFSAGRGGEGCFASYDGRLEFYQPHKA